MQKRAAGVRKDCKGSSSQRAGEILPIRVLPGEKKFFEVQVEMLMFLGCLKGTLRGRGLFQGADHS